MGFFDGLRKNEKGARKAINRAKSTKNRRKKKKAVKTALRLSNKADMKRQRGK